MRRLLIFCLLPLISAAEDRWLKFHTESFELYTNAGARAGRESLAQLEQFRHALGEVLGKPDMRTDPPVKIFLFKTGKTAVETDLDRIYIVLSAKQGSAPLRDIAKILIDANTERMPPSFENGLIDLFSTLQVSGARVTLGQPPPTSQRTKDWARVHLLAVSPEYYGKLRVLLYNLQKGVDEEAAYRNAFGKTPADIEHEADKYLAAGKFETVSVRSLSINPDKDLAESAVSADDIRLALAELDEVPKRRAAYQEIIRIAAAEPDNTKALAKLEEATKLSPKAAEPYFIMGRREQDPQKRIERLKRAVSLDKRQANYWQALAEAYLSAHEFVEAAKAWRAAEQASATEAQRAQMKLARLAIEGQRLDFEESERKRIAAENAREIRKLKDAAIAEVRELEAKANHGQGPDEADRKVVPWWDGPPPAGKVRGTLTQVDCLGRQARLVIETDDRKTVKLLVRDPGHIAIMNGGLEDLGCGQQKARRVAIEYFPKSDTKRATLGDVATIEFQ